VPIMQLAAKQVQIKGEKRIAAHSLMEHVLSSFGLVDRKVLRYTLYLYGMSYQLQQRMRALKNIKG
jgi:hypothetical protein